MEAGGGGGSKCLDECFFIFSSFHFLFQVSCAFIDFTQISTSYVVSPVALIGPVFLYLSFKGSAACRP